MAPLPQFNAPQTKAPTDFGWFVYGSTLDFDALAAWCAEHNYRVPDLAAATPARLSGWRLAFNVRSNFWGGVVGSLVEDPAGHVEGARIPMPADALGFVRHKEGVLSGLFQEKTGTCELVGGGGAKECLFYVANPAKVVAESAPAPRFLATLVKGARERGLSPEWIAALEARATP